MNVLDMYSMADYVLACVARFLPDPLVRWVQLRISRRVLKRLRVPPEWLAEGPDGFQPDDEIDLVFGDGHPNPGRVGCGSEAELIELATAADRSATPDTITSSPVRHAVDAFACCSV
jgi:hypothetical protein